MEKIVYQQNNNIFRIFTEDKIIVLRAVPKSEYKIMKKKEISSTEFKMVSNKYGNFIRNHGFDRHNFPIIECINIKKAAVGN